MKNLNLPSLYCATFFHGNIEDHHLTLCCFNSRSNEALHVCKIPTYAAIIVHEMLALCLNTARTHSARVASAVVVGGQSRGQLLNATIHCPPTPTPQKKRFIWQGTGPYTFLQQIITLRGIFPKNKYILSAVLTYVHFKHTCILSQYISSYHHTAYPLCAVDTRATTKGMSLTQSIMCWWCHTWNFWNVPHKLCINIQKYLDIEDVITSISVPTILYNNKVLMKNDMRFPSTQIFSYTALTFKAPLSKKIKWKLHVLSKPQHTWLTDREQNFQTLNSLNGKPV